MSMQDIQEFLQIGRTKAYSLVRNGDIKSFRVGRLVRVNRTDLLDYMSEKCHNSTSNGKQI